MIITTFYDHEVPQNIKKASDLEFSFSRKLIRADTNKIETLMTGIYVTEYTNRDIIFEVDLHHLERKNVLLEFPKQKHWQLHNRSFM